MNGKTKPVASFEADVGKSRIGIFRDPKNFKFRCVKIPGFTFIGQGQRKTGISFEEFSELINGEFYLAFPQKTFKLFLKRIDLPIEG